MSGSTIYGDRLLSRLATTAAATVPGVEVVSSSWSDLATRSYPRAEVTVNQAAGSVKVNCLLAVSWPSPVTDIASRVQGSIRSWISAMTELEVTRVTVVVEQAIPRPSRVSATDLAAAPVSPTLSPVTAPDNIRVRHPSARDPRPLRDISVTPLFRSVPDVR